LNLDSEPLVSAVITTHNREQLLPRALDSVAVQSYENIEIIVVDDGSTDGTPEVIENYQQDIALKYIRFDQSVGACRARNRGIKEAAGQFVAGLDDDDTWHENRIEELLKAYSDEFACVTSDTLMAYPKAQLVWKKKEVIDIETLRYTNQVGNQVLVPRERLLDVGGFDADMDAAQDYDLWLRLSEAFGPIRNVQKPLQTIYMDHDADRITETSSFKGYLQFYKKHKQNFNRPQRKYQLFNIRRAQQKPLGITELISYVPPFRYWSEVKNYIGNYLWK